MNNKFKKNIAVFASAAMLLSTATIFPDNTFNLMGEITASAEGTEQQETDVASVSINGVKSFYATLEEAFDKSNSGATITLLNDVTLTGKLTVPEGVKLTLDCGEYTLTSSDSKTVYVEGDFFFTGGTLLNTHGGGCTVFVVDNGSFTMSGGVVNGKTSVQSTNFYSNITITDGTVGVDGGGLSAMGGMVTLYGGTYSSISINKKGGTLADILAESYALQGIDGLIRRDTEITTAGNYGNTVAKTLSNVAVVECLHTGAGVTDNSNSTHSLNCQFCGCIKEEECTYGNEYQHDNTNHWLTCEICKGTKTEAHNIIVVDKKEPTCTENGNIAYWKCDDCGTYFSGENGETEIEQSKTVISATGHEYSDGRCTVCGTFEDGIGAHLAGHSISLDGNIGVNFYMELDESVIENKEAYMQFTLPNGDTQNVNIGEAKTETVDEKQYYVFSCNVAPKEITDIITAQIITSDSRKGTVYEYSVMEYIDYIFTDINNDGEYTYDEKTRNLVGAMMFYGEMARKYFNPVASEPSSDSGLDKLTAETLKKFEKQISGELPDGITYYGSSLLLESNTTVRHYFKVAEGTDVREYDFSAYKNGYYYTDIPNISASNLGTPQTTKIGDYIMSYSPMSYAYDVLNSDTASDNLKNLVKVLYLYNQAAEAYQNK
ncbi:MAG: hypothetical protein K2K91_10685 [Ruminococcus sp.]|nr:hypothetical protein [Ruminococcus sp.]